MTSRSLPSTLETSSRRFSAHAHLMRFRVSSLSSLYYWRPGTHKCVKMDTRRTVHCIIGIFVILATLTVVQGKLNGWTQAGVIFVGALLLNVKHNGINFVCEKHNENLTSFNTIHTSEHREVELDGFVLTELLSLLNIRLYFFRREVKASEIHRYIYDSFIHLFRFLKSYLCLYFAFCPGNKL